MYQSSAAFSKHLSHCSSHSLQPFSSLPVATYHMQTSLRDLSKTPFGNKGAQMSMNFCPRVSPPTHSGSYALRRSQPHRSVHLSPATSPRGLCVDKHSRRRQPLASTISPITGRVVLDLCYAGADCGNKFGRRRRCTAILGLSYTPKHHRRRRGGIIKAQSSSPTSSPESPENMSGTVALCISSVGL